MTMVLQRKKQAYHFSGKILENADPTPSSEKPESD